ncbi:hypothetical protein HPB51_004531 [Rhipicephalus microplus]|uniref:Uncharacterized protein n=1 Tax=Rhipicephalus microplus TaxID=6941 RepID=A0A9J6ELR9_RHIMP|nr:hypothetical protein HPB51_004531 [Rhipicephalus microplus]
MAGDSPVDTDVTEAIRCKVHHHPNSRRSGRAKRSADKTPRARCQSRSQNNTKPRARAAHDQKHERSYERAESCGHESVKNERGENTYRVHLGRVCPPPYPSPIRTPTAKTRHRGDIESPTLSRQLSHSSEKDPSGTVPAVDRWVWLSPMLRHVCFSKAKLASKKKAFPFIARPAGWPSNPAFSRTLEPDTACTEADKLTGMERKAWQAGASSVPHVQRLGGCGAWTGVVGSSPATGFDGDQVYDHYTSPFSSTTLFFRSRNIRL